MTDENEQENNVENSETEKLENEKQESNSKDMDYYVTFGDFRADQIETDPDLLEVSSGFDQSFFSCGVEI